MSGARPDRGLSCVSSRDRDPQDSGQGRGAVQTSPFRGSLPCSLSTRALFLSLLHGNGGSIGPPRTGGHYVWVLVAGLAIGQSLTPVRGKCLPKAAPHGLGLHELQGSMPGSLEAGLPPQGSDQLGHF